uniref:Aminopeptidase n=1 Tax=Gasterosteus aculeatus aculeatus TaxID=481459 RepID=A0AAQ4RI02_GASAC
MCTLNVSAAFRSLQDGVLHATMDFGRLTRKHGVRIALSPSYSVEDCSLAVGKLVGHRSVKSAARMNNAVVIFLDSVEKADAVVVSGIAVHGALVPVLPLSTPAVRVTVSNVPPFIGDEALVEELSKYGKVVSPVKKVSSGCKSPLLRHVVSHKRQLLMVLNNRTKELNLMFGVEVEDFVNVVFELFQVWQERTSRQNMSGKGLCRECRRTRCGVSGRSGKTGEDRKIAATDHEPTDARKSFPCFDEPNKKATYTISITHDKSYGALSNMPLEGDPQQLPGDKVKTSFQKSIPMSTYLVCFAVHQFGFVERKSARGVPLRIYAQPSQLGTATYAANTTKIIFDYFEEYFNMTYSIAKLDKIAIPDFGTGAMENWGLITYRETNLLYDAEQSSSYNKQRVASVISHELVHQWFGNIVTMDWWDDLWLNEGFASFFEYIGVEKAEPSWGMRDIMIISDVLPVMVDDALLSSHPIIVNVSTPAEITSVFDGISYSKGASILRMLEDWMGKDKFRDGCRKYLKDYYFDNAKTANFWKSLADVSGLPVADVMDTWTKQMGYPVLDLSVTETVAKLSQRRFLLDPKANATQPPSPLGYKWTIPVKWHSVKSDKNMLAMFEKSSAEHVLSNYSASEDGLLKVNNDHLGFYRVNHEDHMWNAISQQLQSKHSEFDAADRTSYIDDVFALARADVIDYGNAFNLTMYLTNETEYIVWERVASSIAYVRDMLSGNAALYPLFQKLFRNHVKAIQTQLGWNDAGTQTQRLLRETTLGIACQMGDQEALNEASRIFDQWINGSISSVAVNLRLLVYRYGMKNSGTEAKWNIMFQRYKDTSLAQEKDKLLYGLSSVDNVELLYRLLEACKDESVVRSQDLFTVVRYVSINPLGENMAWDWTTLNWDYLVNRYTINDRNLGRLLGRITTSYNTELQLWKMEHFFSRTPNAGAGEMPRQQALETVRNNIEWIRSNENEIRDWLERNVA